MSGIRRDAARKGYTLAEGLVVAVLAVVVCAALSAFGGLLFMLAWNFVVPVAFHGPVLTFAQAWVSLFLLGLIGGCFKAVVSAA